MENCVFCSIAKNNTPKHHIIAEDDLHIAFLDICPNKPGHTLVVPKEHSETWLEMSPKAFSDLSLFAKALADKLKLTFKTDLIVNVLEGKSIPHTHVHLIPLNHNQDLDIENSVEKTYDELKTVAVVIGKN